MILLDKLNAAHQGIRITAHRPGCTPAMRIHRRVRDILAFTTNMEHAGDIVEKNLLGIVTKKLKRG